METRTSGLPSKKIAMPSGVSVRTGPDGQSVVRISGSLPIGWMGSLSLGIGEAGFSIVRGSARRTDRQRWEIELELASSAPGREAATVDYLRLASSRRRVDAPLPIVIESYAIDRDEERGMLVLDLKGVDLVGFLGSLLERLAGLLLFPVEMEIETVGSHAIDRFCLQALGGQEPSAEAEQKLAALLAGLQPAARSTTTSTSIWRSAEPRY